MRGLHSLIAAALAASSIAQAQEPASPPRGQRVLGFFVGTPPCADCSGTLTELTLFSHDGSGNTTYRLKETYLGKRGEGGTLESGGIWAFEASPQGTKERVYRLVELPSLVSRNFLKVSDNELRMLARSGRAIESNPDYTLKRRPVPEKPFPHSAPPGRYLVGFYTGTLPCADCEGVHVELSLFDGPRKRGGPRYWLKETRLGKPESEATVESSGQWRSDRNLEAPGGTLLELLDAEQRFLEVGPDQLKLIQRWRQEFPKEGAGTLTRGMTLPAGATWFGAFGCSEISRGGIDSAVGNVQCGDTVIHYDIGFGGNAGGSCHDKLTMNLSSIGGVRMRICTLDHWPSVPLAVSLPDHDATLYVERATPQDTMVLLAMARNLADLFRAEGDQSSSPSTNQDSRRPSRKMR